MNDDTRNPVGRLGNVTDNPGDYTNRPPVYTRQLIDGVDPHDPTTWPHPLWRYDNEHRLEAPGWQEGREMARQDEHRSDEWRKDWPRR